MRKLFALSVMLVVAIPARVDAQDARTTETAKVAALRRRLLADPTDRSALTELAAIRRRHRDVRREALDALERGLRAYLAGDLVVAGEALKKAVASPDVVRLANSFLLQPLDAMIAECPARKAPDKTPDAPPCRFCGDTGLKDCSTCKGTGVLRCSKCRGRGVRTDRRTRAQMTCDKCGGEGTVGCPKCGGNGVVPCHVCTEKPGAAERARPGPNAVEAVRKVLCMTRYLRAGGLDLYATGALKPAAAVLKTP